MLTGYNGQFSLGHGAFYAIGAYVSAIMMDKWNVHYGWTIPVAGVLCLVVGFLFGLPALRLEGLYLALATFSLALAVPQILKYFEHWTGGSQGLVLSKPNAPFGLRLNPDQWLYFLTLAVLVLLFWLGREPPPGAGRPGHRGHPRQPHRRRGDGRQHRRSTSRWSSGSAPAYTGVAGALSASVIAYVAPDSFNVFLSITLLIGSVIGGLASISGAIFGALFIQFVPNWAQDISKAAPWAIFGVFLIVFMYVMPFGIAGAHPPAVDPDAPLARCAVTGAAGDCGSPRPREPPEWRVPWRSPGSFSPCCWPSAWPPLTLAPAVSAQTVVGVTATEIKIGNTNPYSGPASAYGTIGKVIGAYFKKVNDEGGVNGRKINYITYDDGYAPPKTVEMVRKLVERTRSPRCSRPSAPRPTAPSTST